MHQTGKILIFAGILLVLIGIIVYFMPNIFKWFGHLPGDIRFKNENFSLFAPIASMLVISLVISLLLWIIRKIAG